MNFVVGQVNTMLLRKVAGHLERRMGLYFPENKLPILAGKLYKLCLLWGISFEEFCQLCANGIPEERILQIAEVVTTNHTYFFRENCWDYFIKRVLPFLCQRYSEVRIWSAATSSGEEAYTIAILVVDELGAEEAAKRIRILGTDINFTVLHTAEKGIYNEASLEHVPIKYRRYFLSIGNGLYEIAPEVKRLCLFRRLNLKHRPFPFKKKFHVIFCRNVLYYFTPEERYRLIEALYDQTEPGGWLITSVTESLKYISTRWIPESKVGFYRKHFILGERNGKRQSKSINCR